MTHADLTGGELREGEHEDFYLEKIPRAIADVVLYF